jgi:ribosomal protein S18 acetylase RimI-like enzyme
MNATDLSIIAYKKAYADDLLSLLIELHGVYFLGSAATRISELREETNIEAAYKNYLKQIHKIKDDSFKILLAVNTEKKVAGFIIGSVSIDLDFVRGHVGKIEDWYVMKEYRGQGTGKKLYTDLEKWFIEKGCEQVVSDTWEGNDLSITAHKQSGFFVSGISFSKKLK